MTKSEIIKKFIDTIDTTEFYSIEFTKHSIKLQGTINADLIRELLQKYEIEKRQNSDYLHFSGRFEDIPVLVTLT